MIDKLKEFRKIYDRELAKYIYDGALLNDILSHRIVRAFCFEVCKELLSDSEKPFRVDGHYYKTLQEAKKSYIPELDSRALIECLCVNGDWVKIS